jgi:hypothetical protein
MDGNGTVGAKSCDEPIVGDTGTDKEGSADSEWVNIDSDTGSDPKAKNYARIDDSNITDPTSDEETDDNTLNPGKAKEPCPVKTKIEEKVESTEKLKAIGTRMSCVSGLFH